MKEAHGAQISTADDIRAHDAHVALWVANDACPPSPGCTLPGSHLHVGEAGNAGALVWQYAQSPRRTQFTRHCTAAYAPDRNCYAPNMPSNEDTFLDLNVAASADPSGGR